MSGEKHCATNYGELRNTRADYLKFLLSQLPIWRRVHLNTTWKFNSYLTVNNCVSNIKTNRLIAFSEVIVICKIHDFNVKVGDIITTVLQRVNKMVEQFPISEKILRYKWSRWSHMHLINDSCTSAHTLSSNCSLQDFVSKKQLTVYDFLWLPCLL